MNVLGLSDSKLHHDSSICLVKDGKVLYACMEERFSRLKNDPRAPLGALNNLLESYDLSINEIDAVAVGMPPFIFMKNLLSTETIRIAWMLLPIFFKDHKLFMTYLRNRISDGKNSKVGFEWLNDTKVYYVSHYRSHAASAYRTSGFDEALCVVMDAAGSDENGTPLSGSVFSCRSGEMNLEESISRFTSIGCFYNGVTQAAGFRTVGEDWKLMGLAAFGNPDSCYDQMFPLAPHFRKDRWQINRYSLESKLIDNPKIFKLTKLWKRLSDLIDRYGDRDVAAAAQKVFEDELIRYFEYLMLKFSSRNIVLAGGVFHNIKFCMKLQQRFENMTIYVHPAAGDSGVSLGAALELYHDLTGESTVYEMETMAIGPEYSENEMLGELYKYGDLVSWESPDDMARATAGLLVQKNVVGLFHGRSEWGPRALGQRSVIADPRDPATKDHINKSLKNREWFMPFAPSIIEEDAPEYLSNYFYSPFMTHAFPVTERAKREFPSAIHLDGTARPQVVRKSVLPHYHAIITAFREITGVGAVLNTSFNRHGLPVVNSPKEAIDHLLWGCIDVLVLGPYLVRRKGDIIIFKKGFTLYTDQMIGKYAPFDERLLAIREKRDREGYS